MNDIGITWVELLGLCTDSYWAQEEKRSKRILSFGPGSLRFHFREGEGTQKEELWGEKKIISI